MDHDIFLCRACSCDCRYLLLLVSFLEPWKPMEGATALLLLLLEVPKRRVEEQNLLAKALSRSKNFLDFDTVALSFLFNKHCPIME